MVILEEALPSKSNNSVWMPEDMAPTGARMKCPDIDLTLAFDTWRLCLDQNPAEAQCPFEDLAKYAFDTVVSKFDISKITRFGNRQRYILATDSVEQAEGLSVKKVTVQDWLKTPPDKMQLKSCDVSTVYEKADRSAGVRLSVAPVFRVGAPLAIDKRLTMPPHLLKEGQREALIGQLQRKKQRETEPLAGLEVDIDYWWLNPEEGTLERFFQSSKKEIDGLLKSFVGM